MIQLGNVTIARLGLFAWKWEVELGPAGTAWGYVRTYRRCLRSVRKVCEAADPKRKGKSL